MSRSTAEGQKLISRPSGGVILDPFGPSMGFMLTENNYGFRIAHYLPFQHLVK